MKGTLHKTESGWQIWYHAKDDLYHGSIRVRILPLLQDDAAGLFIQDTDSINDGKEVEFEIVEFFVPPTNEPVSNSISKYAQFIKQSHNYLEVKIICPKCKVLMPCKCNSFWDTIIRAFHIATQQVKIGAPPLIFECWLVDNYNPPSKKQDMKNNKSFTAVEWLVEQMIYKLGIRIENTTDGCELFEQAKEMEKEQIINAYKYGNQSDV